jgi:predicted DNA-binding transcriptional regulator AlpA
VLKLVNDKEKLMTIEPAFLNDKEVARLLGLSSSWVRGQRFRRSHGLPHILTLKPRYIGSCPRYVRVEVEEFVSQLAN